MSHQHISYQQIFAAISFPNRTLLFLVVVILFSSCNILEQSDPAPYGFEKLFKSEKANWDCEIYSTQNGFDIITGLGKNKLIITIDGSGNEIARKTIPLEQSSGWYSTIQTRSGDYVLIGYNFETETAFGLCINKNGEVVWKRYYDQFSYVRAMAEFSNGNIVIKTTGMLCILDMNGQIIKSLQNNHYAETIQILPNGNFILPHFTADSIFNNFEDVILTEYDQNLEIVNGKKYFSASKKFYNINARYLQDSTILFFGNKVKEKKTDMYEHDVVWLGKVTLNGELLWEKEIYQQKNPLEHHVITDISISENNILIITASDTGEGGNIIVLDAYGNIKNTIRKPVHKLFSLTKLGERGNIILGSDLYDVLYVTTFFY